MQYTVNGSVIILRKARGALSFIGKATNQIAWKESGHGAILIQGYKGGIILSGKHAYLITVYNQYYVLERLLMLLDDERNDIYIHVDKKSLGCEFDKLMHIVNKSKIVFIERQNVNWGGASLTFCILSLLKAAEKVGYEYYHLLSGSDLPLKSQDYIHDFFTQNKGCEFVHFTKNEQITPRLLKRVSRYHFFAEKIYKQRTTAGMLFLKILEKISLGIQNILGVNRLKQDFQLKYGAVWFSITDLLVKEILSKENWIKRTFANTLLVDELYLQTIVYNSKFKENLYLNNFDDSYLSIMRFIDWQRGSPYTWRNEDFKELIESPYLFARKFDADSDKVLVDRICNFVICS